VIDIWNVPDLGAIDKGDFTFKVGTDDTPGDWDDGPTPSGVTSETLDDGVTRVAVAWDAADAIKDAWLEVTVKANLDTGLDHDDLFYFGNDQGTLPLIELEGGPVFEPGIVHVHGFDREDPGPGEDFSDNVSLTPASAYLVDHHLRFANANSLCGLAVAA